jgi:hypothetical protein
VITQLLFATDMDVAKSRIEHKAYLKVFKENMHKCPVPDLLLVDPKTFEISVTKNRVVIFNFVYPGDETPRAHCFVDLDSRKVIGASESFAKLLENNPQLMKNLMSVL